MSTSLDTAWPPVNLCGCDMHGTRGYTVTSSVAGCEGDAGLAQRFPAAYPGIRHKGMGVAGVRAAVAT